MQGNATARVRKGTAMGHKKLPISFSRTHIDLNGAVVSRQDNGNRVATLKGHGERQDALDRETAKDLW